MADPAGNWRDSYPGALVSDRSETIRIEQTPAAWAGTAGVGTLLAALYFRGAILAAPSSQGGLGETFEEAFGKLVELP